jgi:cyclohexanecarboxylate-CoA ligase
MPVAARRRAPRLHPTLVHSRAARYRRPGGPWDRGALDDTFAASPPAPVVDDGGRLDGDAVEDAVATMAGRLRAAGVRRGDVVTWQLGNGAAVVVLYRACWRLGAVAAPLHHRLGDAELAGALAQVDPVLVLADPTLPAADVPGSRVVPTGGLGPLLDLFAAGAPVSADEGAARPSDIAVALFTSGSTGVPKAVLHTHRGLGYKAALMVSVHGLDRRDAVLMPAPLAHVSGLLNGVLLPTTAGVPSVVMAGWDPDRALALIEEEKVSFMGAPPVFFSQMTASGRFRPEAVASLRLISTGGASVSPAFVDATAEAFGCRVKRTYGSTEAPTVTTSGADDPLDRARDTDGRATGEVEITVHDPESGRNLERGTRGEVWLRGPELFVGYVDPLSTAGVISTPGRWFRTGDLGVLDEDGWLRITGRLSDIIIRAGENISASEVEAALEAHPSVRHAVAVAVPDPDVGERVAAFVETTGPFDLDACRAWFNERKVTRFKTPEYVFTLDALPVLATGKADRARLRKMAVELSGGS